MDLKRKATGVAYTKSCKKRKLNSSDSGVSTNQPNTDKVTSSHDTINSSDEEEIAELFNQLQGKIRNNGGNKVVKSDLKHMVLQYFDLGFTVIDEIALEGLDGITLEALWKRIKTPELILSSEIKKLIWDIICIVEEIDCYILDEPRPELVIRDELDTADIIKGKKVNEQADDIYGFSVIQDSSLKIVGSSNVYHLRKIATQEIKALPLSSALSYGNKLVLVANQKLRNNALFDPSIDPTFELMPFHYCILERIGRSRLQGDTNLQSFCKDAKSMFYIKKLLTKNGLVRRQATNNNKHIGGAFTLTRFHNESKVRSLLIMEYIVNILKQMPNYRIDYAELSTMFDFHFSLKKFNRIPEFRRYITTTQLTYRELYPDADKVEWKTGQNKERKLRVLTLKDPNVNIHAGWMEELLGSESEEVEEEDNDYGIAINRTLLNQAYEIIIQREEGVSVMELKKLMNIDFYLARMILRMLEKRGFVNSRKVDDFRQHIMRYQVNCEDVENQRQVISKKLSGTAERLKKGVAKMTQLFKRNLPKSLEKTDVVPPIPQEQIKLLCFGTDFAEKLRKVNFKLERNVIQTQESEPSSKRFNFIEQNMYTTIQADKNPLENIPVLPNKLDELSTVRSLLIQSLISGLDVISPALRENDLHDLPLAKPVDEVDNINNVVCNEKFSLQTIKPLRKTERFTVIMGPSPILDSTFVDENGITVEIISSTPPKRVRKDNSVYRPLTRDKSLRFALRANLIINSVRCERILSLFRVKQIVLQAEAEEGYEYQADKRSVMNVLKVVITEGFIKAYKVIISTQEQCFICSLNVQADDAQLKEMIDGLKTKLLLPSGIKHADKNSSLLEPDDINESLCELKDLNRVTLPPYKENMLIGWEYGFTPKFVRLQVLHELLFYLVYDFTDNLPVAGDDWLRGQIMKEEITDFPPIYYQEVCWKMFIPPLPPHKSCPEGWVLFADVLLRIPLSLFVKMYRVKFIIPELNDYLSHPVKKHLLIKHLPVELRSALLYKRNYMSSSYENLWRLCFCGLLQFNRIKSNDKFPQLLIYVNRYAILYDTTTSSSGYNQVTEKEYKQISYIFNSQTEVQQYWYQLWSISMNTPLGYRSVLNQKMITIENVNTKPEMIQALASRDHKQALLNDIGYLPGNHLGAAGLDSSMWPHLKYNWIRGKRPKLRNRSKQKTNKKTMKIKPIKFEDLEQMRIDSHEGTVPKVKVKKQKKTKIIIPVRKNVQKKKVVYYDKIDKMILKKTLNRRAKWTADEDNFLGLCLIAIHFLKPSYHKNLYIPYTAIRDIFHRLVPQSRNKTSRACQRRTLTIYKDKKHLEMNPIVEAENLLTSPFVRCYFKKFRDRMKNENYDKKELLIAFIYLIYYLFKNNHLINSKRELSGRKLLSAESTNKIVPLPDPGSKSSFYSDVKEEDDVKINLIKSIIHSSLSCNENTLTLAYRLYCIYQTFTDRLLKVALQELSRIKLLSMKKAQVRRQEPRKKLILPMLYHVSTSYAFTQVSDYPLSAYSYARDFLVNINRFMKGNESLEKFEQGHSIGYSESLSHFKVKLLFQMPEEALRLNPQIEDHSDLIKELAERYLYLLKKKSEKECVQQEKPTNGNQQIINEINFTNPTALPLEMTIEKVIEKVIKAYDCNDTNQREALQKSIEVDLQNLETNPDDEDEDEEKNQSTKHTKLNTNEGKVLNNPIFKSNLFASVENQNLPTLEEIMTGMLQRTIPGEKRKIPHITELSVLLSTGMFPKDVFNDDDETLDRFSKHFVLTFPTAKLQILGDINRNKFYRYFITYKDVCRKVLERIKYENVLQDDCASFDTLQVEFMQQYNNWKLFEQLKELIDFIILKKEFGATATEIVNKFGYSETLKEVLTFLVQKQVVLKVGVSHIRFIHFEYRHDWFVSHLALSEDDIEQLKITEMGKYDRKLFSSEGTESQKKLIKIAPWIMINGNINHVALKKWCAVILSYCLKNPKLKFNALTKKFCYLKPVDIFSILEYLEELECIKIAVLKYETNLLSMKILNQSSKLTLLDDINDVYVNTSPIGAVIKMGHFVHVLETEFSN